MSGLCWADLLDCTANHIPRSTLANAVMVLQHDPLWGPDTLYYDEFLDRVMLVNSPTREWRDDDDTRLTVYCQQTIGMQTIPETQIASAVRYVARQRSRHCVRAWLASLTWDGTERIAHAFEDFWGAEPTAQQPSDYLRAASANFFLGMVARVTTPGCQLDTMPVFEGAQGIGKSRALRIVGGDWYMLAAESVSSKDFYQTLAGKLLIEIGELDSFSRADRDRIKVAISTPVDRYRSSYGRRAVDHPRQCVFAGTTNHDDYGNDDTGLRRLLPIRCGDMALPGLTLARPQLFAEAVAAVQTGVSWWDIPSSAVSVQRERQHDDPWTTTVLDWLRGRDDATSTDILVNSPLKFRESDIDRRTQQRIAAILTLNGWKRQTLRLQDRVVKGFHRLG